MTQNLVRIAATPDQVASILAQVGEPACSDRRIRYEDGSLAVPGDLAPQFASTDPARPVPLDGPIAAECERRINATLGSATVQASMLREVGYLNSLVGQGVALTPEQIADAVMLHSINDWETAAIAVREALIAANDATYADDAHWPAAPAGLTDFLRGF